MSYFTLKCLSVLYLYFVSVGRWGEERVVVVVGERGTLRASPSGFIFDDSGYTYLSASQGTHYP